MDRGCRWTETTKATAKAAVPAVAAAAEANGVDPTDLLLFVRTWRGDLLDKAEAVAKRVVVKADQSRRDSRRRAALWVGSLVATAAVSAVVAPLVKDFIKERWLDRAPTATTKP